jgi:hypothetical protein
VTEDYVFYKLMTNTGAPGEKNKTAYYRGYFKENGWFKGYRVNEHGEEIASENYMKDGIEHTTQHLIQAGVIKRSARVYSDLKYGNLTTKTIEEQKKKYGY